MKSASAFVSAGSDLASTASVAHWRPALLGTSDAKAFLKAPLGGDAPRGWWDFIGIFGGFIVVKWWVNGGLMVSIVD